MAKRIVVFTNKSARGAAILEHMRQNDIPVAAIIIDTTRWDRGNKSKKLKRTLNRIGIINAHPGLLPQYRGVDVIPWAICNGDPVGVSIHFIDEGIDTGAIIAQETIPLAPGDTFGGLMQKANQVAGKLICDAVLELMETGRIASTPQRKEEGKYYHRMPITLRWEAARKLQRMTSNLNEGV